MIPEQVWDQPEPAPEPYGYQPGKATGAASPLAWAMAQYVRLARAIAAGRPVERPAVVARRYAAGAQRDVPALALTAPQDGAVADGRTATVRGTTDAETVYVGVGGDVVTAAVSDGAVRGDRAARARRQPDHRGRGGRGRRHRHAPGDRRLVRHPHRGLRRSRGRRQRAGHVRVSDQLGVRPRWLRHHRARCLQRRRPGGLRDAHRRRDPQPVGRRPDLAPADQRLPRRGRRGSAAGAAGDQPGHRRPVERRRGRRRPLRHRRAVRSRRRPARRRPAPRRARDAPDRRRRAACRARRAGSGDGPLRRRDVRQRRERRGDRLHPARVRLRLLEQPAERHGPGSRSTASAAARA